MHSAAAAVLVAVMVVTALAAVAPGGTGGSETDAEQDPDRVAEAEPAAPDPPRSVTVVGAGDLLIHGSVREQARADGGGDFDFAPMLAGLQPVIDDADLALCHLEVPLGEPAGPFTGYPTFQAPPQVADAVAEVGYDGCSTASNHSLDQGEQGVERTLDVLDDAGLGSAGTARDASEAETPRIYEVEADHGEPVAVAHLSYTAGFNGIPLPEGQEWRANRIEVPAIEAEAAAARDAGADVVVLSMHWGQEYDHTADADQRRWGEELLASPDIDVIFGHHAHVVQSAARHDDQWVVYGMGNQLSGQHVLGDPQREGVMARVTFSEDGAGEWSTGALEFIPTWLATGPLRVVNLAEELSDPDLPDGPHAEYRAAYDRIIEHLDGADALGDGVEVTPVE